MPSEEADGKGKEKIDDAAAPSAPPPPIPSTSSPARQPSSQPPPEYAMAKNAYEALWKQQSDTRPLATQAPVSGAAAARAAPEATGGVGAAAARTATQAAAPAPMKLHAFQKLVGDEAFIPASSLKILKRIGVGSFATVEVADYVPANAPPGTAPTRVAVKRLRKGSALDAVDLAHEARVLRGLSHRHITRYIGVGASQLTRGGPLIDEYCYIVQAFVGGGTLKRVVAAQNEATKASLSSSVPASVAAAASAASAAVGPSSSRSPSSSSSAPVASIQCFYTHEDAATWGAQIAEGLAYLHGANPVILHRDLKLENVLLTEAPRARERLIYPPPPPATAASAASAASAGAAGSTGGGGKRSKDEKAAAPPKEKSESARPPRPDSKLADFGLAVSFVSPDIDTRRSTLPRYVSSFASSSLGGGSGSGGKEEAAAAAAAVAAAGGAERGPPQQQQQQAQRGDELGGRRVSAVQAQMLRADAGQAMNDAAVARAASELETALSKWTGGAEQPRAASWGGGGGGPRPSASAASASATAGGSTPPSSSTPLAKGAGAKTSGTAENKKPSSSSGGGGGGGGGAPLASRLVSVSNLLRPTNKRVYALTGKTGSYLYMAPEVTLSLPYNEQADVFSLGTVLWELLSRQTVGAAVLAGATGDLARVAELYAHRVARGFRPPLPRSWPEEVRALVTDCWDARPAARPRAAEVGRRLKALVEKGTFAEFDRTREREEDEAALEAAAEARRLRERGVAAEIAGCLGCCSVM